MVAHFMVLHGYMYPNMEGKATRSILMSAQGFLFAICFLMIWILRFKDPGHLKKQSSIIRQ